MCACLFQPLAVCSLFGIKRFAMPTTYQLMSEKYADDVNVTLLKAQLPVFKLMLRGEFKLFHEIYSAFHNVKSL